jgi:hypothetical protein
MRSKGGASKGVVQLSKKGLPSCAVMVIADS